MSKKVIAFVGMPGAGKSTCVDHVVSLGIPSVYLGGVVVDEVIRRYGKTNEVLEKQVREELREKEGMDAVAKRAVKNIDQLHETHEVVVADGLYSWSEYKLLKDKYGDNALIIAIAAPRKVRHKRLENRPVRPLTNEEVTSREYAEIENIEKGGPIANADYIIVNDGEPDEMIQKLASILQVEKMLNVN
jgi:dephospho-CoA kinase